jgi:carbonic anhydrase
MKRVVTALACLLISFAVCAAQTAAPAPTAAHHEAAPAPPADKVWADLVAGNERYVAGKSKGKDLVALRKSLAKGQHPHVMVLSCSDSRVPPELLFDQTLGDLFVVRSAGNIADAIGMGSLEYAFEHLGSTVLVVLGHTNCGAVTAACSGEKMPSANLQAIVDRIGAAVTRAKTGSNADTLVQKAIEENVHQSAEDVLAHSEILRRGQEERKLTVIEAEYDLASGKVTRLDGGK